MSGATAKETSLHTWAVIAVFAMTGVIYADLRSWLKSVDGNLGTMAEKVARFQGGIDAELPALKERIARLEYQIERIYEQ